MISCFNIFFLKMELRSAGHFARGFIEGKSQTFVQDRFPSTICKLLRNVSKSSTMMNASR